MQFQIDSTEAIRSRIVQDILEELPDKTHAYRSLAIVIATVFAPFYRYLYLFINWCLRQLFPWSCDLMYLQEHGKFHGVHFAPPEFARGEAIFKGLSGTVVPAGTKLRHSINSGEYETTEETTIDGDTLVKIRASEPGARWNTHDDSGKFEIIETVPGIIQSPTPAGQFTGGVSLESDADYLARIMNKTQNIVPSGSVRDYISLAQSRRGVTRAFVFPAIGRALGRLQITCIDDNQENLRPENIPEIEEYLNIHKQAVDVVEITSPEVRIVNIIFTELDTPNAIEAIAASVSALINSLEPGEAHNIYSKPCNSVLKVKKIWSELYKLGLLDFNFNLEIDSNPQHAQEIRPGRNNIFRFGEVRLSNDS